ncbi:hypothetical protein [Litorilituus lipolyticus]|uniref:Uncharacterized protein n=1 Tax=Litorilituus lipolyticus TaxID=2491017 RepID=A0A502L3T5_9GAMM|nr:hypothetical protein [Litorilituus lipolyticus]TPH17045.1 hypothetical protein EPA86_05010 [Litorilituus lipolyticus]
MLKTKSSVAIVASALAILFMVFLLNYNSQEQSVTSYEPIKNEQSEQAVVSRLSPIKEHDVEAEKRSSVSDKLDISLPKTEYVLPQKNSPVDIMGGFYDETAQAPESEAEQNQKTGDIGFYDPDALAPEFGFENVPLGEGPKVMDLNKKKKKNKGKEQD